MKNAIFYIEQKVYDKSGYMGIVKDLRIINHNKKGFNLDLLVEWDDMNIGIAMFWLNENEVHPVSSDEYA